MGLDKNQFGKVPTDSAIVKDLLEIRETVKGVWSDLSNLFKAVLEHGTTLREPKSILEMAKCYEQPCDALIVAAKRQEALRYVSGKLILAIVDGAQFSCAAELYFQDAGEKWVVKKTTSGPMALSHLTAPAREELQREGKISFEIFDPELN